MAPPQQLPIAYLPGASGGASVWRPIAERLASRRPPVLCEYPGLGNDSATEGIASLSDLALTILGGLPARCDLAALSMGAAVALRLASEHPERFRRLVLVAAAGGVDVLGLGGLDWRDSFRRRRPQAPRWFLDDQVDLSDRLNRVTAPTLRSSPSTISISVISDLSSSRQIASLATTRPVRSPASSVMP